MKPILMLKQKKGQQMTKLISGTVIGIMVLIFVIFAALFGIATLDPSSFFTSGTLDANATGDLQKNLTTGVSNFGQRIPVVFTILGVVFALIAIVLLIGFVKRMDGSGGGGGSSGL